MILPEGLHSASTNQKTRVLAFVNHMPVCSGTWEGSTILCSKNNFFWASSLSHTKTPAKESASHFRLSIAWYGQINFSGALQTQATVKISLAETLNCLKSTRFLTNDSMGGLLGSV